MEFTINKTKLQVIDQKTVSLATNLLKYYATKVTLCLPLHPLLWGILPFLLPCGPVHACALTHLNTITTSILNDGWTDAALRIQSTHTHTLRALLHRSAPLPRATTAATTTTTPPLERTWSEGQRPKVQRPPPPFSRGRAVVVVLLLLQQHYGRERDKAG